MRKDKKTSLRNKVARNRENINTDQKKDDSELTLDDLKFETGKNRLTERIDEMLEKKRNKFSPPLNNMPTDEEHEE